MSHLTSHAEIQVRGEKLWLLAERALYWPAQQSLFIADLHLGKAAAYRKQGIPVPAGTTAENLYRLEALFTKYPCKQVYFLGDLIHNPALLPETFRDELAAWREKFPRINFNFIPGNHDKATGDLLTGIFTVFNDPLFLPPFALTHKPALYEGWLTLAGHVHPVAFFTKGRRQRFRLPCFVIEQQQIILPSFGEFTGGYEVTGENIVGCYDGGLLTR